MSFWLELVDLVFSFFVEDPDASKAAKWFRDLESKDGYEPKSRLLNQPDESSALRSRTEQGNLQIKVIK